MKIYFETYGCTSNRADTDTMKGLVKYADMDVVDSIEKADIAVLNTCVVLDKTEKRMLNRIEELKEKEITVIITGCLASSRNELLDDLYNDLITLEPRETGNFLNVISANFVDTPNSVKMEAWNCPIEPNGVIGRVQIAEGCLGNCSYCITKNARGSLLSYPSTAIKKRIESLVNRGVKEIQLTAQDTASYNYNSKIELPDLISLVSSVNGDFKIRVGMMNPFSIKKMKKNIFDIFDSNKVYNFLHLPVQSGSDRLLEKMNRNYSSDYFKDLASQFKSKVGGVLATDVIVGFPGESHEDFEETLQLVKDVEPSILNITRYSPRPNTEAEKYNEVKSNLKKERSKKLTKLRKKISAKKKKEKVGKTVEVLVTEMGKNNTVKGRDNDYNQIVIPSQNYSEIVGKKFEVDIVDSTFAYLIGSIS